MGPFTRPLLLRGLVFASTACVVLIVADFWWDAPYRDFATGLRGLHWVFHCATIVLATLGSLLAFNELDESDRTFMRAAATGLLFGLVSIVGATAAYLIADEGGIALWLVFASSVVALSASFFSNKEKPASTGFAPSSKRPR